MADPHVIPAAEWNHYRVTCPKCGADIEVEDGIHTIRPNGLIYPALVCPRVECDWTDVVKLAGWVSKRAAKKR